MCDICNSLFGHHSSCPMRTPQGRVRCSLCEYELDEGEILITFPSGKSICDTCAKDLDLFDLLDLFEVEDVLELFETFDLCRLTRIGRWG